MEHIVSEPKIRIYQFLTTNYLPPSSTPPYKNLNGAPQVMSPMAQMPVPGPVPMMPNMMNPTVIPIGSGPPNPYAMPPYIVCIYFVMRYLNYLISFFLESIHAYSYTHATRYAAF